MKSRPKIKIRDVSSRDGKWWWWADNGTGVSLDGYTMTFMQAARAAKRALRRIDGFTKPDWDEEGFVPTEEDVERYTVAVDATNHDGAREELISLYRAGMRWHWVD